MAAMSTIATYQYEELIIRCAEMASILRDARRARAAIPVLCLLDCSSRHAIGFGGDRARSAQTAARARFRPTCGTRH